MGKLSFFNQPVGLQIYGYLGLTGAGKSLSAVENHVIPDLKLGRSVYSNTWINWKESNFHTFVKWSDLHNVKNSLIFIDEIGDILDPNKYKDFSDEDKNVIRYHRKRGNTLIYTAQDISDIAKQCRVKTHRFILCESNADSFIVAWFLKTFFSLERVCFKTLILTYKDLKKLTLGIGSPALDSSLDPENSDDNFSEDISDISENLETSKDRPQPEKLNFSIKTLLHKDLDEHKLHLLGSYCPACRAFKQYYDKTPQTVGNCPSCPSVALEIKPLAMYDTNHELLSPENDIVVKRFRLVNKKALVPLDSNM